MALTVVKDDTLFRVEGQDFCTSFIPDTPENRKKSLCFYFFLDKVELTCYNYSTTKIVRR